MSNDVDSSDVIIIGGGLASLTTAALLIRAGHSFVLQKDVTHTYN
jgi:glycine/D-amino acid oxidase-like deaminating enzyme